MENKLTPKKSPKDTSLTKRFFQNKEDSVLSSTPPMSTEPHVRTKSPRNGTVSAMDSENSNGINHLSPSSNDLPLEEEPKSSTVAADLCRIFGVTFAILVRVILITVSLVAIAITVDVKSNELYWFLAVPVILIIVEGAVTVITRGGQERQWVCLCFVLYLLSTIPSVWIIHLDDMYNNNDTSRSRSFQGVDVPPVELTVLVQCSLFVLVLCRWLLPRGQITRDQLSQLLFVFIGMSSDAMELFELFDEDQVKNDMTLVYIILGAWTFSLFQFTLVLTMVHNPKKARVAVNRTDETRNGAVSAGTPQLLRKFLGTEIWSLIVTILMQDAPFLAIRLFVLINYNVVSYTIVFFTCKNILVVILLLYRMIILCVERSEDHDDDDVFPKKGKSHSKVQRIQVSPSHDPQPQKIAADDKNVHSPSSPAIINVVSDKSNHHTKNTTHGGPVDDATGVPDNSSA